MYEKILSAVAGDDLVLCVRLENDDGSEVDLDTVRAAELVVHFGDEERVYNYEEREGGTVKYHLDGRETAALLTLKPDGCFYCCVRVKFLDGCVDTPIHRMPLLIRRC